MRAPTVVLSCLLAVACSRSSSRSSPDPVPPLGVATLGPAGGVIAISSGAQAGLRLFVPAGALTETIEVRIVDDPDPPPAPNEVRVRLPGEPFRIEPAGLQLVLPAQLQLPYDLSTMVGRPPGQVLLRREGFNDIEPTQVDVFAGMLTASIQTLGRYRVTFGEVYPTVESYLGPAAQGVVLQGGASFQDVDVSTTPFAGIADRCWRLQFDGSVVLFYFDDGALVGRETLYPQLVEVWTTPAPVWRSELPLVTYGLSLSDTQSSLFGGPPVPGTASCAASTTWSVPLIVGGRELRDVLAIELDLQWSQFGQLSAKDYVFYFTPDEGLVAVEIDGSLFRRQQF